MEITQEQADRFSGTLKAFHDSLADDERLVLEQILEQAAPAQDLQAAQPGPGRPFFDRFLVLNPAAPGGGDPGQFVTLKFPSDGDESDTPRY